MARTKVLPGSWRVLSFPFRLLRRLMTITITVLILGVGGGMGGLDPRTRKKIDQPDKANPIVCVDEAQTKRT